MGRVISLSVGGVVGGDKIAGARRGGVKSVFHFQFIDCARLIDEDIGLSSAGIG